MTPAPALRRGATLVEYGLIVVLLILLSAGALTALGVTISNPFVALNSSLAAEAGSPGPSGGASPTPQATPEPVTVFAEPFSADTAGFNGTWNSGPGSDGDAGYLVASGYQHTGDYAADPVHWYTATVDVRGAGCRMAISWWSNGGWLRNSAWASPAASADSWTSIRADDIPPVGGNHLKFYLDNGCEYDNFEVTDHDLPTMQASLGGIYSERFDRGRPNHWNSGTWSPDPGIGSAPGRLDNPNGWAQGWAPVEPGHQYQAHAMAIGSNCRMFIVWTNEGNYLGSNDVTVPSTAANADWTEWTSIGTAPATATRAQFYLDNPCSYDDFWVEDLTGATVVEPDSGTVIYSTEFDSADDISGWNGSWDNSIGYGGDAGFYVDAGYDYNNPVPITAGHRYRVTLQARGFYCKIGLGGWIGGSYVGPVGATGAESYGEWTQMSKEVTMTNMSSTSLRVYLESGPCSYDHVVIEDLGTP